MKANRFSDQQASEQQQNRTIRVGEGFSERVRKQRALLYPFMKEAIDSNKKAYLKYDKLSIDGKLYTFDSTSEQPVPYPAVRD